ncbi:MAG: tetratricopeptide repeat protein, partial [Nitrospirae bacterium]
MHRDESVKKDYTARGLSLARFGRHKEAIEKFEKALKQNPQDHNALFNISVSLEKLGRLDEAIEYLYKAIEIAPDDFLSHYHLGNLLLNTS